MPTAVETFSPAETYEEALRRACHVWGVQEEYWDIWGERHIAGPEVQRKVLASLGVPANTKESLNFAIEERALQEWSSIVAPTIVTTTSVQKIPIHVPHGLDGGRVRGEFH